MMHLSQQHDPQEHGSGDDPIDADHCADQQAVAEAEPQDDLGLDEPFSDEEEEAELRAAEAAAEAQAGGVASAPAETEAEEDEETPVTLGPGQELTDEELDRQLLGVLFASAEAVRENKLIELLDRPSRERVREALARASEALASSPLPVLLEKLAGGWRLLTDPDLGDILRRVKKDAPPEKLSGAALETLAIVAYRQPVTKAEVEAIRGVQSGTLLRALVDRRLARIVGRADQPGAPLLYGTTKDFLDRFGLESLKALPRDGELVRD